jgi:hypothetical protein
VEVVVKERIFAAVLADKCDCFFSGLAIFDQD